jgi:hypothetical protein
MSSLHFLFLWIMGDDGSKTFNTGMLEYLLFLDNESECSLKFESVLPPWHLLTDFGNKETPPSRRSKSFKRATKYHPILLSSSTDELDSKTSDSLLHDSIYSPTKQSTKQEFSFSVTPVTHTSQDYLHYYVFHYIIPERDEMFWWNIVKRKYSNMKSWTIYWPFADGIIMKIFFSR